jgi:hypothetical protein
MIRARKLSNVHKKRSIRPLYSHHQATPYAAFLDTATVGTTVVSPGMVARQSGANELMATANTNVPAIFRSVCFANFVNGDMDELGDGTEIGVWRGGPDATFEVLTDALEADTWTSLSTANTQIFASTNGKLTNTTNATNVQVARLMEAPSANKIIITLDLVR